MKSLLTVLTIVTLTFAAAGCSKETTPEASSGADASTGAAAPAAPSPATAPASSKADAVKSSKPGDAPSNTAAKAPSRLVVVPEGTAVTVFLKDPISTATAKSGDTFTATIADPIVVKGETILQRGATVKGRVIEAEGSGRVKGTANIRMELTSVEADGKSYAISTRPYAAEADSSKKRDAGIIAGAGGVGAAIGAIAGGGKGAVKGAVIGGAAGTGAVLATKGKEVEFDTETKLTFALEKPASVPKQ